MFGNLYFSKNFSILYQKHKTVKDFRCAYYLLIYIIYCKMSYIMIYDIYNIYVYMCSFLSWCLVIFPLPQVYGISREGIRYLLEKNSNSKLTLDFEL